MIDNLMLGIQTAFHWENFIYSFFGVVLGNLIGVLPGIGALAAISMLLPITYGLSPVGALMMLAGLYYGTSFGGATTSILLNLPGTAQHAVVCVDGNPLARKGRGGSAIFMAMVASFVGVCIGIVLMAIFSPLLTDVAFMFGPEEYFSLMLLGLLAASALTSGSAIKGIASVVIGIILGLVGTDVMTGVARFDFGLAQLQDGFSLVVLAMGLFGIADVFKHAGRIGEGALITKSGINARSVRPEKGEVKQSIGPIVRGSGIGAALGILPGTGGTIASFMSYAYEKKTSKEPNRFGKGAIEGVSGPEAANSSAAITAFIPTLTLGIPGDAVMALMLGALMIHDITPGPEIMVGHPELFWGLIVSFWIGNFLLLIMNIPLIKFWVKLLTVPYRIIFPIVLLLISVGVYSTNNDIVEVAFVLGVGIFGFVLTRLGFQAAPLLLGYVLGPMIEEHFRRSVLMSRGDMMTFFTHPISGFFMGVSILLLLGVAFKSAKRYFGNKGNKNVLKAGPQKSIS